MVPIEQKLLDLLSGNDVTFFIPPYQRNYEWTDDQCDVFFADLVKTRDKNVGGAMTEHFFGTITYFQAEHVFGQPAQIVLIDGQQRITTTMLFLVALRDTLTDENQKSFITDQYLKNSRISGDNDEYKIKLKQVETDWDVYKHIILQEDISAADKDAAVYRNYMYFKNRLKAYQESGKDALSLVEEGLSKFSVVTIELKPRQNKWENPQEIFESMNSLGKPLSLADLVRNYLLLGLDPDTQNRLYKDYWLHIEKTLPGQLSNYIRDFMQWKSKAPYKVASESNYKELYGIFKTVFSDLKAETILKHLAGYADIYAYVLPGGRTGRKEIDYELKDLQYLRVTTAYSFLMGLLIRWKDGSFTDQQMADILDVFRIYCIRRRILNITASENKTFPVLVSRIDELVNCTDKTHKMFDILAHQESNVRLPNDVELTHFLESMNFYNFKYCKFILSLIEEKITRSRPDTSNGLVLQIEHIMPQTLNDAWEKELGPDYDSVHQELINTIGNLTLTRHNQEFGNKSFSEKKDFYENKAGMQIAKNMITGCQVWNKDSIKRRSDWIIDYLLKYVLPIPNSMRRTNNFLIRTHHRLSFNELQIIGETIDFIKDPSITAKVVSDNEVEFEGRKWRLSPLTREVQTRRGVVSPSRSYSGTQYWEFNGMKLADII